MPRIREDTRQRLCHRALRRQFFFAKYSTKSTWQKVIADVQFTETFLMRVTLEKKFAK
jgi:hypothetical protein